MVVGGQYSIERRCDECKLLEPKGWRGLAGFGGDSRVKSSGNSLRQLENRNKCLTGERGGLLIRRCRGRASALRV